MTELEALGRIYRYVYSGELNDVPTVDVLKYAAEAIEELARMKSGTPTNEQKIREMNTEQFARFLDDIANAYHLPWEGQFMDTFCKKCDVTGNTSGDHSESAADLFGAGARNEPEE